MEKTIENQITYYFENNKVISKEELMIAIRNDFPNWSDNTINAYLYLLKKRGIINSLSRGIYTLGKVETFNPLISEQLKKIAYRIHKAYPFINYCVWDSSWLHDLMRHQPFKHLPLLGNRMLL